MELKIDLSRLKWRQLRALEDPARALDSFEELIVMFAVDDDGKPLTSDAAHEELDELSVNEVLAMASQITDSVADVAISPPTPSPSTNGAKGKGRSRSRSSH